MSARLFGSPASPALALDAALEEEDVAELDEEEDGLGPSLAALEAVGGHKTISFFGGLALLTNNVTGPGVAALPLVFVSAGWVPTLLLLAVLSLASGAASQLLCDAIRALPGNADYGRRVELLSAAQELLPRWAYWAAFVTFITSFQMANIGSIIESAQTADGLLVELFGGSCALELFPRPRGRCVTRAGRHDQAGGAFGDAWVISVGYLLVALVTVPLGYYNLDEAIWVQKLSFCLLGLIVFAWLVSFGATGLPQGVAAVGGDASGLIGTLLFNYMFVATVPSWVNEKRPGVSVRRSVWGAVALGTGIFASVGLLGAAAYGGPPTGFAPGNDLLTLLMNRGGRAARAAAFAFPPVALMSGIPVLSICVRYNLLEQEVMSPPAASAFAVVLPWALALLLYRGGALASAMDWTSLFAAVPLNLVLPAWMYLRATTEGGPPRFSPREGELQASLLSGDEADGARGLAFSRAWQLHSVAANAAYADVAPGEEAWYERADDEGDAGGLGSALGGAGPAAGLAPSLGWLPRAGWRGALAELRRGDWLDTEVGRKRAAARAVLFVGVGLNLAAFAVKIALGV